MQDSPDGGKELERRLRASEERLWHVETASGVATFDLDLQAWRWRWGPHASSLFGLDDAALDNWEQTVFGDDLLKLRAAVEAAATAGSFYAEIRVRHNDGSVHWIAGRGQLTSNGNPPRSFLRGAMYEITDRKALEARLLALNETLEARVAEARQETRTLEVLNEVGTAVAAEHDLERLVQRVTDAGVELSHAEFGAFFYNVLRDDGEAYTLYTLSGAPREAFEKFPMPRNTAIFEPTFRGGPPVRSDDILNDPRYGKSAPYHGMPSGHLPVRSYLAASVVSRSGRSAWRVVFRSRPAHGSLPPRAERIVTASGGTSRGRHRQCPPPPRQPERNRGPRARRNRASADQSKSRRAGRRAGAAARRQPDPDWKRPNAASSTWSRASPIMRST